MLCDFEIRCLLEVRFHLWEAVSPKVQKEWMAVLNLDHRGLLLEGPFGKAWYWGERVANHYLPREEAMELVPLPPPESMRLASLLKEWALKDVLQRRLALEF